MFLHELIKSSIASRTASEALSSNQIQSELSCDPSAYHSLNINIPKRADETRILSCFSLAIEVKHNVARATFLIVIFLVSLFL